MFQLPHRKDPHHWSVGAIVALAFTLGAGPSNAEARNILPFGPGVSTLSVTDSRTDRPLAGHVWYPTTTPQKMRRADKSKVWQMAPADENGIIAKGPFPLLVVSHGTYGNIHNQAWLGSALAQRGFIVAMINHPGTSSRLRDPDHARQLWERPVDLSRLVTYLLADETYGNLIETDRIYAAGHSLGGMTVMMAAGAEFNTRRNSNNCAVETPPIECGILEGWSVAQTPEDQLEMESSRKDPRLSKIISLDLGGTQTFAPQSLAEIDVPVLILGSERADMLDQTRESRALAAALPQNIGRHVELHDAGHFDFMGVCKPEGYAILKEFEPGDEMVCVKGVQDREAQHQRIVEEIVTFLAR